MNRRKTLENTSTLEKYKKPAKREIFLAGMDLVVPWKELFALIEPFYPKAGKGRPLVGLERMLRIHLLQSWFNLYYFGMKIHAGADRESRTFHSLVTTPANVHDSKMAGDPLHGEENTVFGDSSYMGRTEDITKKAPGARDLSRTRGTKNRKLTEEEKK